MCPSGEEWRPDQYREWVIERIENMLEGIVDGLLADNEQLTISLKTRAGLSRRHLDKSRDGVVVPPPKVRELNYPGNNAQDAWRFSMRSCKLCFLINQF